MAVFSAAGCRICPLFLIVDRSCMAGDLSCVSTPPDQGWKLCELSRLKIGPEDLEAADERESLCSRSGNNLTLFTDDEECQPLI